MVTTFERAPLSQQTRAALSNCGQPQLYRLALLRWPGSWSLSRSSGTRRRVGEKKDPGTSQSDAVIITQIPNSLCARPPSYSTPLDRTDDRTLLARHGENVTGGEDTRNSSEDHLHRERQPKLTAKLLQEGEVRVAGRRQSRLLGGSGHAI
mmetsp:Transcript_63632/g.168563  ORF Transcript_63632/g.168563 Transcript_63632/m.168563 type:complete len:151 (-) Transcript_63632:1231-1683(-)